MTAPRDRSRKRRRMRGFVLTPLIDVIFLLLVFFMVCSQVAPYSLLDLSAEVAAGDNVRDPPARIPPSTELAGSQERAGSEVLFTLSRGHIRAGDITITLAELPGALETLRKGGARSVFLLSSRSATVQDVATALEAFRVSGLDQVRFAAPRAPGTAGSYDPVSP